MEIPRKEVRSILIVDDDRDDFDLVVEAINEINPEISVEYAASCRDIVPYMRRPFDLVLLDINMPHHDGFHWLKSIRDRGYTDLPVIMYTNSLSPAHIARSYEEGANLYFSKPESFQGLIKALKKLVLMDWTNPYSVTDKYKKQGKYATFDF